MKKKSRFNVFTFMMLIILGLTFQPVISAYAECPEGITSYWKLDEASGSTTYEDFIGDNDGTVATAGPIADTDGVVDGNGAQAFNVIDPGIGNQGIDVAADSSFNWVSSDSFSIEAWVKIEFSDLGPGNQVIIGRRDAATPVTDISWFIAVDDSGKAVFNLKSGANSSIIGGEADDDIIADGAWHYVVAVRNESAGAPDTGRNFLFVDGILQDESVDIAYPAGFLSDSAAINIGWFDFSPTQTFRFVGSIDEVALYDRALDPVNDIQAHYTNGRAGIDYCLGSDFSFAPFPDNTISLWQLDQTNGPAYLDSFGDNDGTSATADPIADTDGVVDGNGAQAFNVIDPGIGNQGIDVAADSSFNWVSSDSFSIEAWVKIEFSDLGPGNQVIIGRRDAATPVTDISWFIAVDDSGKAVFNLKSGANSSAIGGEADDKIIADGAWHHVVAVRDESAGAPDTGRNLLFVDGILQDESVDIAYPAGFLSNSAEINIGWLDFSPTQTFRFVGSIDEVALYDRALEPVTEIPAHYNAGDQGKSVLSLRPAPVADAGDDLANVKEGTTMVTLDGSGSGIGYAGTTVTYLWEQMPGTAVLDFAGTTTNTATFTAPDIAAAAETLTFQLTVTASDGQSSSDTVDVGVVENILPVADAGDPQSVTEGDPVTLDGAESTPVGGISYLWEQVPPGTQVLPAAGVPAATADFTAPQVDSNGEILTFKLTVTDGLGQTDSETVTVTVNDNPLAPTADAGADQDAKEGNRVTLDGSNSSPAAGSTITTYLWEQVPGGTLVQLAGASTATATFTAPDVDETLTFRLTVTDDGGLSSSDTVAVTVSKSGGGGGGGGGGCFINSMF